MSRLKQLDDSMKCNLFRNGSFRTGLINRNALFRERSFIFSSFSLVIFIKIEHSNKVIELFSRYRNRHIFASKKAVKDLTRYYIQRKAQLSIKSVLNSCWQYICTIPPYPKTGGTYA